MSAAEVTEGPVFCRCGAMRAPMVQDLTLMYMGKTEKIFLGIRSKKFQAIQKAAIRKLFQLYAARSLQDLRAPGNSLEALKGDRAGNTASG